ncbi:hypothetical protein E2N91_22340 [Pseudomonas syringae pv. tomato]|nr:hypothetical protein E2N91_22340 [Pseudomonas syringae pv. tomato]TES77173.1 hypothetical protein E2N89_15590 [Pseudomonas syringae pv. tomato]
MDVWLRNALESCYLGCTWCTVRTGFAAGSRQFADKSAPTKVKRSRTSEASPGQLPRPLARIRSRRVYDA